jgi:hypothetical protein
LGLFLIFAKQIVVFIIVILKDSFNNFIKKSKMKEQDIQHIINKLNRAKIIFLKLIKANDVGATGAHQAGFHLPKSSWRLFLIPRE